MQFYTLETKTRVAMTDMLGVIFKDLDVDRAHLKEVDLICTNAEDRITRIEYSLGLVRRTRPQLFTEIDDKIADLKSYTVNKFTICKDDL